MSFEAYSVAVKLSLHNGISSGLGIITRDLAKTGAEVTALQSKLVAIGKTTFIGGALLAGGLVMAAMFKAPLEEAQKFQNEMQRFKALNLGDAVNRDAFKFANGMNTYGTSMRENLSLLRDAQTVFGDLHEAKMVTPLLAKMKFANAALYGDEGGAMKDRAFMDMLKVIEMRGGLASETAFNNQANMVQRVQTATGGRVGANEFLNFIKTGGVAAKGLRDDIFYYGMEPLIQEMSGNRVGTGLMSGYQNLVQGRTTTRAANELMRIGMLNPSMVEWAKDGRVKQIKPGALKGADLMVSDPMKWMQTVLLPSFTAKGITSRNDILNEIGAVFTNRTAAQLYSTMFLQQANIAKNYKLNKNAAGVDQLDALAKESYTGKKIELEKKWADLMLTIGNVVLPTAIKAVEWLTSSIKALTTWAKNNQGTVKLLTWAFAGLSAVLVGAGMIMLIKGVAGAFGLVASTVIGLPAILTGAATAIGALSLAAKGLIGVVAAAGIGYGIGTLLNDHVINPGIQKLTGDKNATLGTWIYDKTHPNEGKQLTAPLPPKSIRAPQQPVHLIMDGKVIAKGVIPHIAKEASKMPAGQSGFNHQINVRWPGY